MSVLIIDNGLCNLDSIRRAVEECGAEAQVRDHLEGLAPFSRVILPGVGNFKAAMKQLRETGFDQFIRAEALEKKTPFLGICLGMQLMATSGEEGGDTAGLDLVPGKVRKMKAVLPEERIPHMGWNAVGFESENPLFNGIESARDFYFVHSYHFVPDHAEDIAARTPYCGEFVSAIRRDNCFGVQFHPEKSQQMGLKLIRNFLEF